MHAERLTQVLTRLIRQPWAIFLWGAPGVGKSSVVRAVAASLDLPVIDLRASLLDPTDLRGIPIVRNGQAEWCPPVFLPKPDDKPGILFLDELNAAPPLVQAGLYQLVLDRRVGEYVLPDGWHIIAAGNRASDRAVTFRMSSALANRFVHLTLDADASAWIKWAESHQIHPFVVAFIRLRPDLLSLEPDGESAFPTPRSWEMLSDVLKTMGGEDEAEDVIPGIIGKAAAIEFLALARRASAELKIESILANPTSAPLPDELDLLWVLESHLIAFAERDNIRLVAAELLSRLSPEFSVILAKGILAKQPRFMTNPAFRRFMAEHSEVFR